jgi:hypothetical protein
MCIQPFSDIKYNDPLNYSLYGEYSIDILALSDERYKPQMTTGYLLDAERNLNC